MFDAAAMRAMIYARESAMPQDYYNIVSVIEQKARVYASGAHTHMPRCAATLSPIEREITRACRRPIIIPCAMPLRLRMPRAHIRFSMFVIMPQRRFYGAQRYAMRAIRTH